jgi:hypothetical protein
MNRLTATVAIGDAGSVSYGETATGQTSVPCGGRTAMSCRFMLAVAACLVGLAAAHAAPPTLSGLFPTGGRRGETATVTAAGSWSRWPIRAWCDSPEVTVTAGKEPGKLEVKISADALPITRWIRLHDDEGASELRPFVIGGLQEVVEQEPNDDPKRPHELSASAVIVSGKLAKAGDVDGFAVPLKQRQTLVASVDAARTLRSPMDGVLQLVSPDGFVVAQNDDYYGVDPHLAYTAPKDGNYLARVFAFPAKPDSSIRFAGGDKFVYRLTLTTGAFADYAFPLAVQHRTEGKIAPVDVVGWNAKAVRQVTPTPLDEERAVIVHPLLPRSPLVRLEPHATAIVSGQAKPSAPLKIALPTTISGRMQQPGAHAFEFDARKGQKLVFEIEARQLDSPLDPVLRLTDGKGMSLAEAQAKKLNTDPTLSFSAAADGTYRLEVRDLHEEAGPRHFYRLRALRAAPDLGLSVATDRFTLAPGKTLDIPVTIERRNGFVEEVTLVVEGLPDGVEAAETPLKASAKTATIKLSGSSTGGGAFRILARSESGLARAVRASGAEPGWTTTHLWLTVPRPK